MSEPVVMSALAYLEGLKGRRMTKNEALKAAYEMGTEAERGRVCRELVRPLMNALGETTDVLAAAVAAGCEVPGFDPEEHHTVKRARAALAHASELLEKG